MDKNTLLFIFIFFLISPQLLNISWDIGKATIYIVIVLLILNTISFELEQSETSILIKHLTENSIDIVSVIPIRSLEDYFLNITSGGSIA